MKKFKIFVLIFIVIALVTLFIVNRNVSMPYTIVANRDLEVPRLTIINSVDEYMIFKAELTQRNPEWNYLWEVVCITERFDSNFGVYIDDFFEEKSLAFVNISSPNANDILELGVRRFGNRIRVDYIVRPDNVSLTATSGWLIAIEVNKDDRIIINNNRVEAYNIFEEDARYAVGTMFSKNEAYAQRGVYLDTKLSDAGIWSYMIVKGMVSDFGYSIDVQNVSIDDDGNVEVIIGETLPNQEPLYSYLRVPAIRVTLRERPNEIVVKTTEGEVLSNINF